MNLLKAGLLLLTGIIVHNPLHAGVKLPALIGNNMVLQQNALIKVWGWADAGEKISVIAGWQSDTAFATTSNDGTWKTTVRTPKAGGPYSMIISGRDYSISILNVLIGEVWVCSGQSNMDFTIRGLGGWKNYKPEVRQEVGRGMYSGVRMFTVKKDTSALPLADCNGNWSVADTNTVNDFSATAWFFGAYLHKKLGIPVGLIAAAWGGTPAEVWTPVESIKADPDLGFYLNHFNGSEWWPGTPGVLFNAMIQPLTNFTIKGAIWYQGESNCSDARLYPELMKTMITSWRNAWGDGDFPFYYVQIAPFAYEDPYSGALLREAQLKCLAIPNTGMAVIMDLVDNINDIHPKNKLDVGKRLALWALNKTYGRDEGSYSGPLYSNMKIPGNSISLGFLHVDGGLKIRNSSENNFSIAGADRVFYPATVKISGEKLLVSSSKVKQPVAVRYAFTNSSEATFFNTAGLPAPSFRTDNWDIITDNVVLKSYLDPSSKRLSYLLSTKARESDIYYAFNKVPGTASTRFLTPIPAGKPATLYATVSRNGFLSETTQHWKLASNKAMAAGITYKTLWSDAYAAGAKLALLDGILASDDYRDGSWQGFEGNDLDVVIDLGKSIQVNQISCNFLADTKSWIFLPKQVSVQVSDDGLTYTLIGENFFPGAKTVTGPTIQSLHYKVKNKIRFIRLTALNQGVCPQWHPAAGNKAWLLADEIVVE